MQGAVSIITRSLMKSRFHKDLKCDRAAMRLEYRIEKCQNGFDLRIEAVLIFHFLNYLCPTKYDFIPLENKNYFHYTENTSQERRADIV